MRSERLPQRLLAVGLVFVVLGVIHVAWFNPKEYGQGAFIGGAVVVIVALVLMLRGRSTH
jgi:uncharacterized RDD family membrane protein YckC